jgi:hypothetical protein
VTHNQWTRVYHHKSAAPVWTGREAQPGGRSNSYTAVDGNDLLLAGGEGEARDRQGNQTYGDFQDVWRFTPSANRSSGMWQQESGSQTLGLPAQYGKKGVPSGENRFPPEHAGYTLRVPFRGSLWFLGGENGEEQYGMRNDLWSYSIGRKLWTWESGTVRAPHPACSLTSIILVGLLSSRAISISA